jgi:predicted phosphodiesterase
MTPIKKWKKWLAVGCSHGAEIDPEARKAVLIFKERWKPDKTLHLGDFIDLSAFRAGAVRDSNDSDHAADVAGDLSTNSARSTSCAATTKPASGNFPKAPTPSSPTPRI